MQSLDEIYLGAREIVDASARTAYLEQACGADVELRRRVEAMLADAVNADNFFGPTEDSHSASRLLDDQAGTVIGRYKLLEKIGEGGMGVVYMAEQERPVRRRVALKIIKVGMDTRQVIARFEAERQALSMMDHPHIAQILDAGATETGRPYFVMELVQGVPITQFCDANQLSIEQRLKLFIPVSQAIQSAHQKGIIHRDLKPSNVLVTIHNATPHPMVIDFGVAKAIDQKLTEKTLFTNFATMIGTPAYMSPEQAEMSRLDVDTRSDIYSLGVLLYELLTGTTPFPEERLRSVAYGEMQRIIAEEEPERPSTRLKRKSAAAGSAKSQIVSRRSQIENDLDWIVMKCLEKDRARRYETVNALTSDVTRFFNSEPIMARAPTIAYRFKKLVHRNKLAFSASAAVFVVLIVAVAASSWQAVRANRERAKAERRLAATLRFVESVFSGVSEKLQNLVGGATANEILNTNGLLLMQELQRDVGHNPEFDLTLGKLYTQMAFGQGWTSGNTSGNYDLALSTATQAIRLLVRLESAVPKDEHSRRLARAHTVAGYAAMALRRHDESLAHFLEMDKWAKLLARSSEPDLAAEGAKLQRWAMGCTGEALECLGQPEKALREYYLPFMQELQGRNVFDKSKNWTDLHDLVAVSSSLGRVYNALGQSENASRYLRQAHHVLGVMRNRFPNDAQVAAEFPLAEAELGRFLLAHGLEEGLKHLESATNDIQRLVRKDRANVNFAEHRIKIARLCALGFAKWSGDASVPALERQKRVNSAQLHLDEAEAFLAGLPSEPLRNTLSAEVEEARKEVAAASYQTAQPDSASSQTPKRRQ